jgi:hypothetical protein
VDFVGTNLENRDSWIESQYLSVAYSNDRTLQ